MSKWKLKHCAPDLCFLRSHIAFAGFAFGGGENRSLSLDRANDRGPGVR